jgi:formylglycine-generating enzyme required for sulfatase activity
VTLPGFYVDRTEVTNEAWAAAVAKGAVPALPGWPGGKLDPALAKRPATGMSFEEAVTFAEWAKKRIPTSAEWEKAARGPADDRAFPWGARFEPGKANVQDGGSGALEDVGSREGDTSPYGVRDMAGNALEWVVGENLPLAAGGGFLSHQASARVTARLALQRRDRHPALGLRLARDVEKD